MQSAKGMILLRAAAIAAVLVAISGCALLEQFLVPPRAPTARVDAVRMTDLTFEYVELTADITLSNPNSFALELARLAYAVDIDDSRPVSGRSNRTVALAAEGDAQTELTVQLRYEDLFASASSLANRSETAYRLEMVPGFDVPVLGPVDIPLSWEGTIPVLRMPSVRFDGLSLESVSFLGAQIAIGFEISNPNAVSLNPDTMRFSFSIDGREITDGRLDEQASVAAESSARRTILVDLRFLETGDAVRRIIQGSGRIPYTFEGELAFGLDLPFLSVTRIPFSLSGETRF
ncbi:MAG: hypothetical protein EA383_06855 [Spirochaetaceae bacterium]|nr:MAG: hypothetical protein EA383_06855 [Spirochaetaceae bacterium]